MQWRIVEGTNGKIEVSDRGEFRSLLRGEPKILKQQKDRKGYFRVTVTIEREKKTFKVHREVAKAFIANDMNLPQINHKDGDKSNNSVENLEWCSNKQNALHAIANGLWGNVFLASQRSNEARKRPIIAYRLKGSPQTKYFESISSAEKAIGSRHICAVLNGERLHTKGWAFQYAREVMPNAVIGDK
jgi:hypothetical protein